MRSTSDAIKEARQAIRDANRHIIHAQTVLGNAGQPVPMWLEDAQEDLYRALNEVAI